MMPQPKQLFTLTLLSVGLTVTCGWSARVAAQSIPSNAIASSIFTPPNEETPGNTAGGASRGEQCPSEATLKAADASVMPLLPDTNHGLTAQARPTFSVYLPETSAPQAFFSISDLAGENHYYTELPLGDRSGVFSFQLPETAADLETGKAYKWSFVLMCDGKLRPDSPLATGWIRRVESDRSLTSRLETATPYEQARLYGEAGLWYDMVAQLIELKRAQPEDETLTTTWEEVLNAVGLDAIARAPLATDE
jgi:hypothetical protein